MSKYTKRDLADEIVYRKYRGAKNPPSAIIQGNEADALAQDYTKDELESLIFGPKPKEPLKTNKKRISYEVRREDIFADEAREWTGVYSSESPEAAKAMVRERRSLYPGNTYKLFIVTEEELDF